MKRIILVLFLMILASPLSFAAEKSLNLPKIFVYTIPDDDTSKSEDISPEDQDAPESDYINELPEQVVDTVGDDVLEEINLSDVEEDDSPIVTATTLKGYAEYVEDVDSIYLKDEDGQFVLNLKVPQKIGASDTFELSKNIQNRQNNAMSKYIKEEHAVADRNIESVVQAGDFKFGTAYGQEVDNISMLENSTSLFTKYEREKFSIGSKYEKTMNTTIGTFSDVLSFEPEYKLNNYISIKEVLKANFSKNRKSSELVLSISPYGRHKGDRLRLEFGARYTVNQDNSFYGTQLNFSTKFKL